MLKRGLSSVATHVMMEFAVQVMVICFDDLVPLEKGTSKMLTIYIGHRVVNDPPGFPG